MFEAYVRRWHRRMGLVLAVFIIVQAGSGVLLSLADLRADLGWVASHQGASQWEKWLSRLHYRGGPGIMLGRLAVGGGMVGMAISGCLIFITSYRRRHRRP